MERSYQSFQAPRDVVIQFGASDSVGNEKPGSLHFLNLNGVQPMSSPYGTPVGNPVDISIALSPRQVAQIVKHFFVEVVFAGGIYQKFFERLMTKRWALMTAAEYKSPVMDSEAFREMHYHKDHPSGLVLPEEDVDWAHHR
ncbi:MAG: hypothetical protein HYT39_03465 [Candidatus Sungbacteria bacterium]|nr:hypothetical protein [Candidatus Sungbacteria bacterium]